MSTAWLFPGQGAQQVGMGRALAEASAAARVVFERADAALGFPLSRLCFEGPEAELALTANTQPALLATGVAAVEALREARPELAPPACAAGHSLGEWTALVAAGALALEDALRLVRLRGEAMQGAVPAGAGAMAAVLGGDAAAVTALCADAAEGEVLTPANFNGPGQVVIAGAASAVARATALAGARRLKAIPLKVSAPFHCPLMAPAAHALEPALAAVTLTAPAFPIVCNVDATPLTAPAALRSALLRQVCAPVRWEESVRWMAEAGVTVGLELGPGKVLAGLIKRIDARVAVRALGEPAGWSGAE